MLGGKIIEGAAQVDKDQVTWMIPEREDATALEDSDQDAIQAS